ncbi:hypothetical protein ARMGADRAFT_1158731 [Armillaria gallica]|uniref:Uncharacterized protein n=1 Tax=Armillaria gallica TaxID=47427 RepID=A0A2H3EF38_ARMGA|nr:hypothetical protein ARMGADRAFT_1158731 [Armillaria gallica]
MTTDVPSRLICPITKCCDANVPLKGHLFGLDPHEMVIHNIDNCIAYRPDILQNAINGDFALVPTITTLNKMLRYFKLPYNTNVVCRTRTSGAKFIKRRQILFTEYMPETAFRYLFVPLTPAGEAIRDLYVKQEQVQSTPYPELPSIPKHSRKSGNFASSYPTYILACDLFSQMSATGIDPPAWFRRRYKDIEFETFYDDYDEMDANTSDEEELLEEEEIIVNSPEADEPGESLQVVQGGYWLLAELLMNCFYSGLSFFRLVPSPVYFVCFFYE